MNFAKFLITPFLPLVTASVRDEYKKNATHVLAGNKFSPLLRKRNKISRGTSHNNNNSLSPDEFSIKLKHHFDHYLSDVSNFSRVSLFATNKCNLKNTAVLLQDNLNETSNFLCCQWYSMAFDIIESKYSNHKGNCEFGHIC